MAQPGSAPVWGTGGRGFKSLHPDTLEGWITSICRMIEDECSPYAQFVISELRQMTYAPGDEGAHMDAENLLNGVQAVLHAAMGRHTELLDAEQPNDPALDLSAERNLDNPDYPDFFHRVDSARCLQCISFVKRMNSIAVDFAEIDSMSATLPPPERRMLAHSLIGGFARQPHVAAAAQEALQTALRIHHTEDKRESLPYHLRRAVEHADFLYGPMVHRLRDIHKPHPLHGFLDGDERLSAKSLGGASNTRKERRACGSPHTYSGEPCQNRVAHGVARCAAGHFVI